MKLLYISLIFLVTMYKLKAQYYGIGTTNPQVSLHVEGNLELLRVSGRASYVSFFDERSIYKGYLWNRNNSSIDIGSSSTSNMPVTISPNALGAASFLPNGHVGISNDNPSYPVDVSGRMLIRAGTEGSGIFLNNISNTEVRAFSGVFDKEHIGLWGTNSGWGTLYHTGTGNIGIGKELTTGSKVSLFNNEGVSLELEGGIRVSGTNPAAFRLTASNGNLATPENNIFRSIVIDHPMLNNNPDAICMLTPVNFTDNVIIFLYYDSEVKRWKVSTANQYSVQSGLESNESYYPCRSSSNICVRLPRIAIVKSWEGFKPGHSFNILVIQQ